MTEKEEFEFINTLQWADTVYVVDCSQGQYEMVGEAKKKTIMEDLK